MLPLSTGRQDSRRWQPQQQQDSQACSPRRQQQQALLARRQPSPGWLVLAAQAPGRLRWQACAW